MKKSDQKSKVLKKTKERDKQSVTSLTKIPEEKKMIWIQPQNPNK